MSFKLLADVFGAGAIAVDELDVFLRELKDLKDGYRPEKILPDGSAERGADFRNLAVDRQSCMALGLWNAGDLRDSPV